MKSNRVQTPAEPELDVALGLALRRLREYRGMTQSALAEKAHVSQAWISLAENAERTRKNKRPSLKILQRIALALGLPGLSDLIRFAERMTDVSRAVSDVKKFFVEVR